MHIVCPHCSTAYAIGANALGQAGRPVRCSRCKETWLARPEDVFEAAPVPAMAAAGGSAEADAAAEWEEMARTEPDGQAPLVASPPIAGDWVEGNFGSSQAGDDALDAEISRQRPGWFPLVGTRSASRGGRGKSVFNPPATCAAMGALVLALIIWRADVVRLLPQTAPFYKMTGLDVNLRGLAFKDVKVTTETVEGKPVLVIEGVIVGETRKTVEIPRLRFSVRDAQGTEIYAWNTVLEQTVLQPGDHALFKSRLASPPAEGKSIDIRFFNKRDIAGGSV
jgi:predicted Zn finger-like uncharacterized protein